MPRKNILLGIGFVISGSLIFMATAIHALYYSPEEESPIVFSTLSKNESLGKEKNISNVTRLVIPSIGINAKIDEVGFSLKGNMMVPDNFTDVGLYKYGPTPGTRGSAVIDGHVDNGMGFPAVFANLKNIPLGASIYVYTEESEAPLHFKVTDKKSYFYTDAPLTTIFNRSDAARLNLITCDGEWVSESQTNDHRLVVYTELVTD